MNNFYDSKPIYEKTVKVFYCKRFALLYGLRKIKIPVEVVYMEK